MYYSEKSLSLRLEIIKILNIMKNISKVVAALILSIALLCAAGCKKHNSGNGSYNGHDYVDLGLPSGTLWATCNVGADIPEGYGDHFAWGETTQKTAYYWSTYKYCNEGIDQLTKYCTDSNLGYNGFTDNLTTLRPKDDAATANWGSGWLSPTIEQWRELENNTTGTWTTQNGVNGRLFTASNGNSIFLPAAGIRMVSEISSDGSRGFYWSSSLIKSTPYYAYDVFFDSIGTETRSYCRYMGQCVRAVRKN